MLKKIFAIHAPADDGDYEQLQQQCQPKIKAGELQMNSISAISAGARTNETIQNWIDTADCIVVLISANLFDAQLPGPNKSHISWVEKVCAQNPKKVFLMLVRDCRWQELSCLTQIVQQQEPAFPLSKALHQYTSQEKDTLLKNLAGAIMKLAGVEVLSESPLPIYWLSQRIPFYQSTSPLLSRPNHLTALHQLLTTHKQVVLHGDSGIGKTVLVAQYVQQYGGGHFHKIAYIHYRNNLAESIIWAMSPRDDQASIDEPNFYRRIAVSLIREKMQIDNCLLLIDGLKDTASTDALCEELSQHYPIDYCRVIVISHVATQLPRGWHNYALLAWSEDELMDLWRLLSIENNNLPTALLELPNNPFVVQLAKLHLPHTNINSANETINKWLTYLKTAPNPQQLSPEVLFVRYLLKTDQAETPILWLLLQIAALPPGGYDAETLADYLGITEDMPYIDLHRSYQKIARDRDGNELESTLFDNILNTAEQKGYLQKKEDDYYLHDLMRAALHAYLPQRYTDYYSELIDLYHAKYFEEEFGTLRGNIQYYDYVSQLLHTITQPQDTAYANLLHTLAQHYEDNYQWAAEEKARLDYADLIAQLHPAQSSPLLLAYYELSQYYRRAGKYQQSFSYAQKALDIALEILGNKDPDLATIYNNIGVASSNLQDYDTAITYFQKAIAIREEVLPSNHADLAISYHNIASVYYALEAYDTAITYHQKAIAIWEEVLPSNHPHLANSYNNIANVYDALEAYDTAITYHQKAIAILEEVLPSNHADLAISYHNIAKVYDTLQDYDTAIAYYQKAIAIGESLLPQSQTFLILAYENIAKSYEAIQDMVMAEMYRQKAENLQ